jgi:DNA (cytosine-5)-methyltransferase 1
MKEYKLRGVSLFANVGIAEAYLDSIGVDMKVANEFIPQRAHFYQDVYTKTLHETLMEYPDVFLEKFIKAYVISKYKELIKD